VLELTAGIAPACCAKSASVDGGARRAARSKIMTVGEARRGRVLPHDFDNHPLSNAAAERLRDRLVQALDEAHGAAVS